MDYNCGCRSYHWLCSGFEHSRTARSSANIIIDDAKREADVIKEKKILQAKEEEMKILADAERTASQKVQKAQASETRARQKEQQLNQQVSLPAEKEIDSAKSTPRRPRATYQPEI